MMIRKALNADLSRFSQDDLKATLNWLSYAKRHLWYKFWCIDLLWMIFVAQYAIGREIKRRYILFPGYKNPYKFGKITLAELNRRWDYSDELERDALISAYWLN